MITCCVCSRFAEGGATFWPRPDSSELHHPPPSLANCGTAETGEIFRAVGAVLQDQVSPETR